MYNIRFIRRGIISNLLESIKYNDYILCRDSRNKLIVLISFNNTLRNYNNREVRVSTKERVPLHRAHMNAVKKGRQVPLEQDMYEVNYITLRIANGHTDYETAEVYEVIS